MDVIPKMIYAGYGGGGDSKKFTIEVGTGKGGPRQKMFWGNKREV